MFLQAAADFSLDMVHCWYVGDKVTDIEAGRAAGIGHLVSYVPGAPERVRLGGHWVVPDLRGMIYLVKDAVAPAAGRAHK
jgi:histidinol phosphatase-like enzyme